MTKHPTPSIISGQKPFVGKNATVLKGNIK